MNCHSGEALIEETGRRRICLGIAVEPHSNLVLLSFGEFDRRMRLAALPLDRVLTFARTHELAATPSSLSVSECIEGDVPDSRDALD